MRLFKVEKNRVLLLLGFVWHEIALLKNYTEFDVGLMLKVASSWQTCPLSSNTSTIYHIYHMAYFQLCPPQNFQSYNAVVEQYTMCWCRRMELLILHVKWKYHYGDAISMAVSCQVQFVLPLWAHCFSRKTKGTKKVSFIFRKWFFANPINSIESILPDR